MRLIFIWLGLRNMPCCRGQPGREPSAMTPPPAAREQRCFLMRACLAAQPCLTHLELAVLSLACCLPWECFSAVATCRHRGHSGAVSCARIPCAILPSSVPVAPAARAAPAQWHSAAQCLLQPQSLSSAAPFCSGGTWPAVGASLAAAPARLFFRDNCKQDSSSASIYNV